MRIPTVVALRAKIMVCTAAVFLLLTSDAQNTVNVRVMAANLNGNTQSYQPFALRILQGLKPDVVCIQEFNYSNNAAADFRYLLDTTFGTNFVYYREPFNGSGDLPNGVISRWPIVAAGSWADAQQSQPNRGFAWAQIQLPGTNSLYVVSVHLLTSTSSARSAEATALKNLIQANFPTNAWVVLAGDFNTDSRTESTTMTTCDSYLSDVPVPVDNLGNSNTSGGRNHPHDYVLPSFAFTNFETATVLPSHSFPSGLVFDSTVYTPLSDVAPVQFADSTNAQHMAVLKDFLIPAGSSTTNPPTILSQPQSQRIATGNSVTFSVVVTGTSPLNYQWLVNSTNISGATANTFTLASAQLTNAGNYSVTITNLAGSITSSNAVLIVTNAPPTITIQPQNQNILAGQTANFSVTANGTAPLNYQWLFNGTNISGAITNPFALTNAQAANAGNYSVILTNLAGSVTSAVATLSLLFTNPTVFAQWNFNSLPPDASTSTGSAAPSLGTGTASLIGGATATFATGDPAFDPAGGTDNSGWNTATYPTQGTGNKTRGVQFATSTAGRQNIVISWSSESPGTGSKYGRLQYATNGTDFTDFPTAFTNVTTYNVKTNSLAGLSGVNNNSNFAFRFVAEFESTAIGSANANFVAASGTYGPAGTMRYDMITVSGTAILTGAPAVLSVAPFAGSLFGFTVAGTAGLSYTVQTSTNLAATNWIPIFTSNAPFLFGDTNILAPQKFYRAVSP